MHNAEFVELLLVLMLAYTCVRINYTYWLKGTGSSQLLLGASFQSMFNFFKKFQRHKIPW